MFPLAEVGPLPELVTVEVEAVHSRGGKADDDTLAIGHGRGVAVPIGIPVTLLLAVGDILLPDDLAIPARQANQAADSPVLRALSEKNPVSPDHRCRVSLVLERDLPFDVLFVAPLQRHVLFFAESLSCRTAPGWPVGGLKRETGGSQKYRKDGGN